MDRLAMVQEIITYHPVYEAGMSRGWSNWRRTQYGGQGDWDLMKLIFAEEEDLTNCLTEIKKENEEFNLRWNEHLIR